MSKSERKGFFYYLFSSLNFIRSAFVNVVFWGIVILLLYSFIPRKVHVPEDACLFINPSGNLVERNSSNLLPLWMESFTGPERDTSAFRLSRVIRMASEDERVRGIILDLSDLDYASLAVLQEIRACILSFKERGKFVYAWADRYNLYSYYLAASADKVYMDPMGKVLLPGYSLFRTYYGRAMDKWNLDMAYFHAGEFKSYGDSYLSSSMSSQLKKENSRWLSNLWSQYLKDIEYSRSIPVDDLKAWISSYPENLQNFSSEAEYAQTYSLVDQLLTYEDFESHMLKNMESGANELVDYDGYERLLDRAAAMPEVPSVCVLAASGEIHEGESGPWSIGSDSLVRALDRIGHDRSVRALVLRLDTGGGSADASELIRRKLQELKRKGISVVISMGGVTASGGYWIATAGDEIWAAPGTITGSIGVFTMIPQIAGFAGDTLGITSDGVGTTWMSGQERLDQNLNDKSRTYYQTTVNQTYNRFLSLVSESRDIAIIDLKPLAEGRIWSGSEARDAGLADHMGTLTEAVASAADLAGLEKYNTIYVKEGTMDADTMLNRVMQGRFSLKGFFPRTESGDSRSCPRRNLCPVGYQKLKYPILRSIMNNKEKLIETSGTT